MIHIARNGLQQLNWVTYVQCSLHAEPTPVALTSCSSLFLLRQTIVAIRISWQRFSALDHFLLSGSLFDNAVDRVFVDHGADNLSDHDPIFLELRMSSPVVSHSEQVYSARPAWRKASPRELERCRTIMTANLAEVLAPAEALSCQDVLCKNALHVRDINAYDNQIIEACAAATAAAIPMTCARDRDRVPGWKEFVESVRQHSLFWHRLSSDCGRPRTGTVAEIETHACCVSYCGETRET
jgi:hypothetical protein